MIILSTNLQTAMDLFLCHIAMTLMIGIVATRNIITNKTVILTTTTINNTAGLNSTVIKKVKINSCKKAVELFYRVQNIIGCNLKVFPNNTRPIVQKKRITIKYSDLKIYNISSIKIIGLPGNNILHIDSNNGIISPPPVAEKIELPCNDVLATETSRIISDGVYRTKLLWMNILCMLMLMITQVILLCRASKNQYREVDTLREYKPPPIEGSIQTTTTTIDDKSQYV